jgi:chromosome partitioning protein
VSLIPANLYLYNAEYELAAQARDDASHLLRLKQGLDTIKDQFDVIIIDPPPALGMISLSVLQAATAMVVPVPPSNVDFSSTAHFFTMLKDTLSLMEQRGMPTNYKFVKVLVSKKDERKASHQEISEMMRLVFGSDMLNAQMRDSAEIDNAAANFMTVLELHGPQASRDTYKRAMTFIQAMGSEIELEIRKTWPSHRAALHDQGLI